MEWTQINVKNEMIENKTEIALQPFSRFYCFSSSSFFLPFFFFFFKNLARVRSMAKLVGFFLPSWVYWIAILKTNSDDKHTNSVQIRQDENIESATRVGGTSSKRAAKTTTTTTDRMDSSTVGVTGWDKISYVTNWKLVELKKNTLNFLRLLSIRDWKIVTVPMDPKNFSTDQR